MKDPVYDIEILLRDLSLDNRHTEGYRCVSSIFNNCFTNTGMSGYSGYDIKVMFEI